MKIIDDDTGNEILQARDARIVKGGLHGSGEDVILVGGVSYPVGGPVSPPSVSPFTPPPEVLPPILRNNARMAVGEDAAAVQFIKALVITMGGGVTLDDSDLDQVNNYDLIAVRDEMNRIILKVKKT